jgi:hypothetical protein
MRSVSSGFANRALITRRTSRRSPGRGCLGRPGDDRAEPDEQDVGALAEDLGATDRDRDRLDRGQPEARVARVVERERAVLAEGGHEQRAELLLVLRARDHEVRQLALGRQREHPLVARPVLADEPARSTAISTGWSFWQTSCTVWSKARCRNVE